MATAKIIIKAQDQTQSGINSAKSNLKELNEVASSLGINLGKLTAVGAVTAGLVALAKGAKQCADAFLSTENTYLALESSLKKSAGSYSNAITQISKLSKTTLSSKSDIAKLYTELVQLGKGETEINKILEASISLANVTGKDLNSAMELLLSTYQGSAGELTKYLPQVSNLTKEELALGKAVDVVNDSLSDLNNTIAGQSYSQSIKNIKDDLQTIAEAWGEQLLDALGPVITFLESSISKLAKNTITYSNRNSIIENMGMKSGELGSVMRYLYSNQAGLDAQNNDSEKLYNAIVNNGRDDREDLELIVEYMNTLDESKKDEKDLLEDLGAFIRTYFPSFKSALTTTANNTTVSSLSSSTGYSVSDQEKQVASWVISALNSTYTSKTTGLDSTDTINYYKGLSKAIDAVKNVLSSNSSAVNDLSKNYKDSVTNVANELISSLQSEIDLIVSTISQAASSLVSAYAESYLSDSSLEKYNNAIKESLIASIKETLSNLSKTGQGNSEEYKYLSEIKKNLESGFDKSVPSAVNSILSANTKYFTFAEAKQYETLQAEEQLAEHQKIYAEAVKQLALGNGSKEEVDLLGQIVEAEKEALEQQKKSSINFSSVISTISSFSSYLSSDSLGKFNSAYGGVSTDTIDSLITAIGESSPELTGYLNEIKTSISKGLDPSISTNVKSILSSNTKYFNDEEARQYEIAQREEELAKNQEIYAEAVKQLALGNGNEEEIALLGTIIANQQSEITELKKGGSSSESNGFDWDTFESYFTGEAFNEEALNAYSESVDLGFVSDLTSSFGELMSAVGSIGNILLSSDPLLALLFTLLTDLCAALSPLIEQVFQPLNDVLSNIVQVCVDALAPVLQQFKGIFGAIGAMLNAIIVPTLQVLAPILQIVTGILEIFKPILLVIVKVFGYVGTVIDLVVSSIEWCIAKLLNWLADIEIFGWHPFGGISKREVVDPSWERSYNKIMGNALNQFDEGYSDFDSDTSTSTSVSTASYQGASNFYFNIYQQAPVVGEGGMQEFALMIKKEFAELAYIGA